MESWEPFQHLLFGTGKPRKTCVEMAGRRTSRDGRGNKLGEGLFAEVVDPKILINEKLLIVLRRQINFDGHQKAASIDCPATSGLRTSYSVHSKH